jgi:hypothetical protein
LRRNLQVLAPLVAVYLFEEAFGRWSKVCKVSSDNLLLGRESPLCCLLVALVQEQQVSAA